MMWKIPVFAALIGCGTANDLAASCGAPQLDIVLGSSDDGGVAPLADGEEPVLVYGAQGGFHVDLAVQVEGLGAAPAEPLLHLTAEQLGEDGTYETIGGWERVLPDPRDERDAGPATWDDLRLIVDGWSQAHDRIVTVEIECVACGSTGTAQLFLPGDPLADDDS